MKDDAVMRELRKAREEQAKKFDYDLKAIVEELKATEAEVQDRVVVKEPKRLLKKTG